MSDAKAAASVAAAVTAAAADVPSFDTLRKVFMKYVYSDGYSQSRYDAAMAVVAKHDGNDQTAPGVRNASARGLANVPKANRAALLAELQALK